mgnify:CR=1 FL=1
MQTVMGTRAWLYASLLGLLLTACAQDSGPDRHQADGNDRPLEHAARQPDREFNLLALQNARRVCRESHRGRWRGPDALADQVLPFQVRNQYLHTSEGIPPFGPLSGRHSFEITTWMMGGVPLMNGRFQPLIVVGARSTSLEPAIDTGLGSDGCRVDHVGRGAGSYIRISLPVGASPDDHPVCLYSGMLAAYGIFGHDAPSLVLNDVTAAEAQKSLPEILADRGRLDELDVDTVYYLVGAGPRIGFAMHGYHSCAVNLFNYGPRPETYSELWDVLDARLSLVLQVENET